MVQPPPDITRCPAHLCALHLCDPRWAARRRPADEWTRIEPFTRLNILVFTETDTRQLIDEILAPASRHYLGEMQAADLLSVFGVDGEYGRHYTFLKAIAVFWNVVIEPQFQATFKIDLD